MAKLKKNTVIDSMSKLIIKCVEDYYKIDMMNNKNLKSRKRAFVEARSISFNLINLHTNLPYSKIGSYFGKDHTTVIYGINLCNNLMSIEKDFLEHYQNITKNLDKHLSFIKKLKDDVNDAIYVDIKKSIIREKIHELRKELSLLG